MKEAEKNLSRDALVELVEKMEKRVEKLKAENKRLKEKYQSLIDKTFTNMQKGSYNGTRETLVEHLGKKGYLKKLLTEKKGSLWTADRLLLLEMVEGKMDKELKAEAEATANVEAAAEVAAETEDASKDEI